MNLKIDPVRKHALSLEAVTEEPHHHYSSFRVRGKIFVTIPPGEDFIHVFVGDDDRQRALALYPGFVEKLLWGSKVLGLRVALAAAQPAAVKALVDKAYETRVLKDAGPKTAASRSRKVRAGAATPPASDARPSTPTGVIVRALTGDDLPAMRRMLDLFGEVFEDAQSYGSNLAGAAASEHRGDVLGPPALSMIAG